MATRIGVDVGGTFTDLVAFDSDTESVYVGKASTTPHHQEASVAAVIESSVPRSLVTSARFFLHGNTVGINALLERRGATIGLIATRGFRDVLETRRGERLSTYDPTWKPAPPLVPRRLRLPVTERIAADGRVLVPLVTDDVVEAVEAFNAAGVDCVAVSLINAYVNPEHELEIERILREAGFTGDVSLSHRVSGELREYERTSTTVIDAYVRPSVSHYLSRLSSVLGGLGFTGECMVTRSGGGSLTFAQAIDRPFETIMSGPVAGVVGAAARCKANSIASAVTLDVGGTSSDVALILDGAPLVRHEAAIDEMPIQSPWVDVRSIGAGGGSIAFADPGRLLRVGPRSAGAEPGPACYGRGGVEPTVTDAAAYLGMLGRHRLSDALTLDLTLATAALDRLVANLSIDRERVACGVIEIAKTHMVNAIRRLALERGEDLRSATLIAFGGMGPLLSTLLARELEMPAVLIPEHAGNFSALGLLEQDLSRSIAHTFIRPLAEQSMEAVGGELRSLAGSLSEHGTAIPPDLVYDAALDLRFSGQEHSLTISIEFADDSVVDSAAEIRGRFAALYSRTYGHMQAGQVEISAVRLTARTPLPKITERRRETNGRDGSRNSSAEAYSFSLGRRDQFAIWERCDLRSGVPIHGPAIITEATSTTYVDAGFVASLAPSGDIWIRAATDVGRFTP